MLTIFTSTFFIGCSIDLPNIALFFNLEFCFLTLLSSFSASFCKSVLRLIYGFKNGDCLNYNTL